MAGFIEGVQRSQTVLFPERLEDWIGEDDLVRVVDLFVDELDLSALGFEHATSARTGRPGYHPAVLLKLFIYGYVNRILSSRRLEREAGRNVEVMWLTDGLKIERDHRRIPPHEWSRDPQDLRAVRGALPADRGAQGRLRGHRRQQVQSRQQP
ncbi:transposase-like protein DUF772 [Rhodobacter maris]|uniref:Transposase-like protein DUF772 n=1 Tax=Rhodobacter maris TaxID=446682 RepID=A0A285TFR7_9RHOB|nr:transposase-like protein DUF772 [Rhodobacter maris]